MVSKELRCFSGNDCANTTNCHCQNCKKYWSAVAGEDRLLEQPERVLHESKQERLDESL